MASEQNGGGHSERLDRIEKSLEEMRYRLEHLVTTSYLHEDTLQRLEAAMEQNEERWQRNEERWQRNEERFDKLLGAFSQVLQKLPA
jgi:predicted nuclease with TOPRIM domain